MSHRPTLRRTAEDWQEAYDGLDERHRQLQQRFNACEQELKLLRVSQRRATAEAARSARAPPGPSTGRPGRGKAPPKAEDSAERPKAEDSAERPKAGERAERPKAGERAERPKAGERAWASAAPPDPSMVWGMERSVQNYITANALHRANEELRQRLDDAASLVASLQRELTESRALVVSTQARLEEAAQQVRQLVRERDVACQKLSSVQHSNEDLERALETRASDAERVRFSLETQITELRGRLVVGADNNEQMSRDVRTLLAEVKEKSSTVQSLQSRLALAESALASQRQNNESLLVELHSLNGQLVNERKRLLSMTREAQLAGMRGADARDLEAQLASSRDAHTTLEREHVRVMESLVHVTEGALRQAREEVRGDLADARATAAHWEKTAQMLYRDVAQRVQGHVQCREECEEAKRARDENAVALRMANTELRACKMKLDLAWPTHAKDTEGLRDEELRNAFTRPMWPRRPAAVHSNAETKANANDTADDIMEDDTWNEISAAALHLSGDVSPEEQVRELQEANAALVAEIVQLRATGELQAARIRASDNGARTARETNDAMRASYERREAAAHAMVRAKVDRVEFLEAQVRSLRGFDVAPNYSLSDVAPGETVFELFLGQIISTETPQGTTVRNAFPPVFCSADFLLHETVTTPVVTGLNAFFDTTVAFCVAMDALLLCYLQSRELLVQLHRVRPQDEIGGISPHSLESYHESHTAHAVGRIAPDSNSTGGDGSRGDNHNHVLFAERFFETIAEGSVSLWGLVQDDTQLHAPRPALRGHIPLRTPSGDHIASVEFNVTVRAAFTDAFRAMAADATRHWAPPQSPIPADIASQPSYSPSHVSAAPSRASPAPSPVPAAPSHISAARSASLSGLPHAVPLRLVPAAGNFSSTTASSTLSSSLTPLLPASRGAPVAFTHVPRAAASVAAMIKALFVDVSRLRLSPRTTPVPRLACYYAIAPIHRDVRLSAPPTPRCVCEYIQESGARGTRFPIASARELLAVTREPLMLFFVDEDADHNHDDNKNESNRHTSGAYWAIAMVEWRAALERPGEYAVLDLPLVSPHGTRVEGGEVRVRLLAESVSVSRDLPQAVHGAERSTPQRQSGMVDESLEVEMLRRQLDH